VVHAFLSLSTCRDVDQVISFLVTRSALGGGPQFYGPVEQYRIIANHVHTF
jgi:hypothetical protein